MNIVDRRLVKTWAAATIGAGLVAWQSGFLFYLMLTIVGIPIAVILTLMPGFWIYLTSASMIYGLLRLVWRGANPLALLVIAAIPPLAAGIIIPIVANKVTEERVATLLADDHGSPPELPPGLSITYAIDRGLGSPNRCSDVCQRLIFSRTATSFIELPLDMVPMLGSLPEPVHRFSLGPIVDGCDNSRLQATYASDKEGGHVLPPPRLWDKLPEFQRRGECFHDNAVHDARADVLVLQRWNYDPDFRTHPFMGGGWRLSLHPIAPFKRSEVFRKTAKGWTRLMRRTEVEYAQLSVPLWLEPGGVGIDSGQKSPTTWTSRDFRTVGSPTEVYDPAKWNGMLANDMTLNGLR